MTTLLETPPQRSAAGVEPVFRALDSVMPGQTLRLGGLKWDDYLRFNDYRDRVRPNVKLTYSHGELEIVAPSFFHDHTSRRIASCAIAVAKKWRLEYIAGGSTTFDRKDLEAGLEPDECFYFGNWRAVSGITDIDLSVHPPPDLAIEVDRYNSSLDKFSIYHRLGVPELWRFDPSSSVTFLSRQVDGEYVPIPSSLAIPMITSEGLTAFLGSGDYRNDLEFDLALEQWVTALELPKL